MRAGESETQRVGGRKGWGRGEALRERVEAGQGLGLSGEAWEVPKILNQNGGHPQIAEV